MIHPSYESKLHSPKALKETAKKIKEILKENKIKYVAVSGISGVVMGSAVSLLGNIGLVIIRKENENKHWSENYQGPFNFNVNKHEYAIVDDLIDSGKTVERITHTIGKDPEFVILYQDEREYSDIFCLPEFTKAIRVINITNK